MMQVTSNNYEARVGCKNLEPVGGRQNEDVEVVEHWSWPWDER